MKMPSVLQICLPCLCWFCRVATSRLRQKVESSAFWLPTFAFSETTLLYQDSLTATAMQALRTSLAVSRRVAFTQQRAAFSVSALTRKDATDTVKETADTVCC